VHDPLPQEVTAVIDGEKVTVSSARTVDLDQPARFARLNDRYGRWGLALLEAIVRCADMTVSEEGS
jgi:CRISPR-associated endonuclease/helicase Cas3